uniref:NADH dehydrogenase subunit 2 n=1 Tax=Anaxilaus musgravei TaxID=2893314 RepID=UPI001FA6F9AA|nr:NADH dehydrogenase subunit 2 [Anaxilaus musgravei]QUT09466.1 NADH dehydrogenase subunit 2 [Anaxilaus musgravei]
MKKSNWLFFMMLILSTLITLTSNNWIGIWMGLELNMLAFIPIILSKINKSSSEAAMIYFLTQSVSSILLLTMILINMMKFKMTSELINLMITLSILIKLGAAPFHKWMPDMMSKMKWNKCMLLMTWQKVAPLMMMSNMMLSEMMINISIIWSVVMGSLGGINQSSLRKMMAYSSINHLGWLLAINKSMNLWMLYLLIYMMMVSLICYMFKSYNVYFINQITSMNLKISEKLMMFIMMLSMGGLPPFIGFLPKWMVINSMINNEEFMMIFIMVMFSLITLLYYIRIMMMMMLSFNMSMKWSNNNYKNITAFNMMINLMLPIIMILDIL